MLADKHRVLNGQKKTYICPLACLKMTFSILHYPHLRFARQWDIGPAEQYALGQCEAIVGAISEAPFSLISASSCTRCLS